MAPHSSILARRIPWTEELCGLQKMGSQRVGHVWAPSILHMVIYMNFFLSKIFTRPSLSTVENILLCPSFTHYPSFWIHSVHLLPCYWKGCQPIVSLGPGSREHETQRCQTSPPKTHTLKCGAGGMSRAVQWLWLPTSTAGAAGLIPSQGTKIPYATWHSQKIKKNKI